MLAGAPSRRRPHLTSIIHSGAKCILLEQRKVEPWPMPKAYQVATFLSSSYYAP